jgi:hypothetical protein
MSILSKIGGALKGFTSGILGGGITGGIAGLIGGIKGDSGSTSSKLTKGQTSLATGTGLIGQFFGTDKKPLIAPAPVTGGSLSSRDPAYTGGGVGSMLGTTGSLLGGSLLGGAGPVVAGAAASAAGGLVDQVLQAAAGPGGLSMAMLIGGQTAPASAGTMQGLMQMGTVLWDAAKRVIAWCLEKMEAIQKQLAKTGLMAWGLIKKLEGEIWDFLKAMLPYAGIAAVVAGVGLGVFFGWSTMKRWAKALWNKLMGKKKRRRRGISARDLSTTRRTINKLKTMKKAVRLAKSF